MTAPKIFGDRYQIGETLGFGGMSEVHRGRDLRLGRDVAIKVLRADLARDPSFQTRFRREAQNAASLNHPAIVAVYDTGDSQGEGGLVSYIVMEYVDGQTLRDILRKEGPLPAKRAMEIMADVCAALDFSHRHGIVHRDVKPANIMLTKAGAVKVMDFGIARALNDSQNTMTATAAVIGTAQYLSPEQARGEAVDARSDVYATGCVLFELLTGQPPFTGDSPVAIAYQHVREDAKAPSEVNPAVPAELDAIVLKALNKNPLNRYQSAAEMRSDMVRALSGQAVHATPVMSNDERTELMRATPARVGNGAGVAAPMLAPPSRIAAVEADYVDPAAKSKRVWGFVGVGALCIAVLIAAIWVTISVANRPEPAQPARVPDCQNLTKEQAEAAIRDAGFTINPQDLTEEVDDAKVGLVVDQNPSPNTLRDTSEQVQLTIGIKRALVDVPNVVSKTKEEVEKILKDGNLTPEFSDAFGPAGSLGKAQSQDPAEGKLAPGSIVKVVIGKGPETATPPDWNTFKGKPLAEAKAAIEALGFTTAVVPRAGVEPKDTVLEVVGDPPNVAVAKGSLATIYTSDNSLFIMPNLENQTADAASQLAIQAGWTGGTAITKQDVETANPAQIGKVIQQNPATGTPFVKVGAINVQVGVEKKLTVPGGIVGIGAQAAANLLASQGFTGTFTTVDRVVADPAQVGLVVSSNPTSGSVVKFNQPFAFEVGVPPAAPATPPSGAPPTPGG
ncbi:Stk1 family PASTA domain-containing Ser/Thr kinase [Nakamurella antarctica]|uniref:non-specific serine/threonine protein kinase n=1 Tax=Nakamurella antarctica TaxID=1902245 RepID=A0A3G8ZI98_9ACTN|nr:Stk1 family PASTA domain-containing Ser/Thr kinase [Nakamurella antarctica]AZI56940.1 Stk1 family PASTA domain-containing Ser/Thr kinase [Nakamurella antarctica]